MRDDIQKKMIERSVGSLKKLSNDFKASMKRSGFSFHKEKYEAFFTQLDAALAYVSSVGSYTASDEQLKQHLDFLRSGTSDLSSQLYLESSANLLPLDSDGAKENNERWHAVIHQLNGNLTGITGNMHVILQSIELLIKYKREDIGSPGVG